MTTKIEELEKEIKKADSRSYLGTYSDKDILEAELKGFKDGKQETLKQVKEMIDEYLNPDKQLFIKLSDLEKFKQKLGELK